MHSLLWNNLLSSDRWSERSVGGKVEETGLKWSVESQQITLFPLQEDVNQIRRQGKSLICSVFLSFCFSEEQCTF